METLLLTRPPTEPSPYPGRVLSVPYGSSWGLRHGTVLDRLLHYPRFSRRAGELLGPMVRSGEVDVVHAQGLSALGYARLREEERLRAPLVMNPQGMEEHKAGGLKGLALGPLRRLSREAAQRSDRVIATDQTTLEEVRSLLGVPPSRIVVIENGIDLQELREKTPGDPRKHLPPDLATASPLFLSVTRLEPYKGLGDIVAALERIAPRLEPGWAWAVVGEGPSPPRVEALAPHVKLLGRVDESLLNSLYASADLFVHATRYEGSSLVTLEAMAHALGVVATRAGGIPDKVVPGETGLLSEPGDVASLAANLEALSGDRQRRRALGAAGRKRVEALFSWDALAAKTLRLYEELLRAAA